MTRTIRRQLLALAALAMTVGTAQGAIVYQLQNITFATSSVPGGVFPFGGANLPNSVCYTCGAGGSLVTDDGAGNLTVDTVSYWLNGFGADMVHTFSGTSSLGNTSLIKAPGETCVDGGAPANSPHLCNSADQRAWVGDWYNGLMPDGVTQALTHQFAATVSGDTLTLRVRKNRDATPVNDPDWLEMSFNYQVVPVPAAVWLFGSAAGLLGLVRRRRIAAQA